MKKTIYFLMFLMLSSAFTFAQNCNLIVFAEEGEKFQVVLNGVAQNEEFQSHVRISELRANRYRVKILFEDETHGEIDKNMEVMPDMEYSFRIKKRKKASDNEIYALRFYSEVPMPESQPPAPTERVIVYHSAPLPPKTVTQSTTTTTTTNTNDEFPDENININMNIGVNGVGVNVNANTQTSETFSQTTTTTTTTTDAAPDVVVVEASDGCINPMSAGDFASAKQSISSKDFEESKLKVAQQITAANCLLADQVKQVMLMFDFEDAKLEFAKFAYEYTFDIKNYYKVNDAFDFESSIEELDAHIRR